MEDNCFGEGLVIVIVDHGMQPQFRESHSGRVQEAPRAYAFPWTHHQNWWKDRNELIGVFGRSDVHQEEGALVNTPEY